ncbi:MAG: permease-like cell division protein FtsX [Bacteroidales bacterium]|nr:permease-like cell division protein FtsX [Bacteroidales bacterium]
MATTKKKISYFSANVTAVISVALVLLLLGIVAVIGVGANGLSEKIKENIGFDISMKEDATEHQIAALRRDIAAAPFTARMKYVSKEDALEVWREETGEDLMAVLGFNPLTAEIEVHVRSNYSDVASIDRIAAGLKQKYTAIESVTTHRENIEAINRTLTQTALVLGVAAAAMLIISLALINNTVRMTIYSKRFLIHTMKLVGATPGFIRRPIVVSCMINGIIAAFAAVGLLSALLYYLGLDSLAGEAVREAVPIEAVGATAAAMVVLGALLCCATAFFAANKYIRLDYDRLF